MAMLQPALTGCSNYVFKFDAAAFVHSNYAENASMSFLDFEGEIVFKLKCGNSFEGKINYSAELENGSINAFCGSAGTKTEHFSVSAGGSINDPGGELSPGTVCIIVEADEKCHEGKLSFEI